MAPSTELDLGAQKPVPCKGLGDWMLALATFESSAQGSGEQACPPKEPSPATAADSRR